MRVEFYNYDPEETDVYFGQEDMSKSSQYIAIENDDGGEGITIYMSFDEAQDFVNTLQKSLNKFKEK